MRVGWKMHDPYFCDMSFKLPGQRMRRRVENALEEVPLLPEGWYCESGYKHLHISDAISLSMVCNTGGFFSKAKKRSAGEHLL